MHKVYFRNTPYKNYMRSHCGGSGGSWGSVFNTTYNFNCSCGHGGFWRGFGMGLGNAFGSLFSGLFGGFNMGGFGMGGFGMSGFGMGGFGMGGFGMSGFGMGNMFGGFGNWGWNSGTTSSSTKTSSSSGVTDRNNKSNESNDKANNRSKTESDIVASNENETATPNSDNKTGSNGEKQVTENGLDDINNATDLNDLMSKVDYKDLKTESEKDQYKEKAKELAKSNDISAEALQDAMKRLPDDVRKAVKQSLYTSGYENVTNEDATEENIKSKLKQVIDTSDIADITPKEGSTVTSTNGLLEIKITCQNGTPVTYTQLSDKDITEKLGYNDNDEIIFISNQKNQLYVLQKNSSGEYYLVQYKYHTGYGEPDVTSNKK